MYVDTHTLMYFLSLFGLRKETLMSFLLNRLNFSVWRGMNGTVSHRFPHFDLVIQTVLCYVSISIQVFYS